MESWRCEAIWADASGRQARNQETRIPLYHHLNNLFLSACLATVALNAAAHAAGAVTLKVAGFAIDAPQGCIVRLSNSEQKLCRVEREDGTELAVSLAVDNLGEGAASTEEREELKQALEFFFEIFIEEHAKRWASEAPGAKLSSADLPASRTPRGMTKCKSFTTKATKDGLNVKERGLLCYVYNEKKNIVLSVMGTVQDYYIPSDGQKSAPNFDKQAAGILATLRAR